MATLRVQVEQDHLEKLVRRPLAGLVELLWNSIDADANEIHADLERNAMGGIDAVVIKDTGTGISQEQASLYFSNLGGSWKKSAKVSEGGRPLHGQAGQGRWSAYGLGDVVRWTSVAEALTGGKAELRITGRRGSLKEFDVQDATPISNDTPTGTEVRVEQLNDAALKVIERDEVIETLTTTFALVLERHPIDLTWRGKRLDPAKLQREPRHSQMLTVDGIEEPVELIIIEWAVPQRSRSLHLCDTGGSSLYEMKPGIQAPGFDFTAYLRWDGFHDMVSELALSELGQEPLASLVDAAKNAMRVYFSKRAEQRGTELVTAWKADSSYPFQDEPSTVLDRAKREMFDIVAVSAAPAVENIDTRSRKLSLRLMREALENSPAALHAVLREVLELAPEHVDELHALLETTSLSAMITAARRITDRLDFLQGLEELVFNRDIRKHVLERKQLHRILASETWVFREEYALTADDVTLTTALRDHIRLLGRDDLVDQDVEDAEVLDATGARVVVDLMLSRVVEQSRDHREHVVIELKRPTVHIGMEQISQLSKYAYAVAEDSRFASTDTRWEFWIVGDEIADDARLWVKQKNREAGVIFDDDERNVIGRAVTWAQILRDARHRLRFVKDAMEYSTSTNAGMSYLTRTHSKYLPDEALAATQDESGDEAPAQAS